MEAALQAPLEWMTLPLELRRQLLEHRMLDSDLRYYASSGVPFTSSVDKDSREGRTIRRLRAEVWVMAAAVTVLASGLFLFWIRPDQSNEMRVPGPGFDPGVAVLTRSVEAQWKDQRLRSGDALAPGRWTLTEGTVELEFYSGASVILEAPAELELVSENGGILHHGKLQAQVPHHAHGFTITTKELELVDLGTSFGMEVDLETGTAVHVFDGKVELFTPDSDRRLGEGRELNAGEGSLVRPDGGTSEIEVSDANFLSHSEMESRSQALQESGYGRWLESSQALGRDSRLVAHYDFEPELDFPRSLSNRSSQRDEGLKGAIIGAQWSKGRWPDKGALDFKRPSDRVRIMVPGEARSMTLVASVRIDGFDNLFHSLLLSDGWDRRGALHWQIHRDGYIELAVWNGRSGPENNSRAPFVMQPSDFGRWMQLAAVYDGEAGTVTQYRDGEVLGSVQVQRVVPLRIGNAEIGNWSPPPHNSRQIRHFNGRIDEVSIFDQMLTAEEIRQLYENENP